MNSKQRVLNLFCAVLAATSLNSCFDKNVTPEANHEHDLSHNHGHHHHGGHHHEPDHDHDHDHDHEEFVHLSPEQMIQAGIFTAKVQQGELKAVIRAPGRVVLKNDKVAHVIPSVNGTVDKVYKEIGDEVLEGEVLAVIRSREMADAKSQYLAALKLESLNDSLHKKEASLYGKKISTEQEFLKSQHDAASALIHCDLACQRLFALGLTREEIQNLPQSAPEDLALYSLRAPISGTVIEKDMTQGENVDGTHENFQIADLNDLRLEIALYPSDLSYVKKGQPVQITGHNGGSITSTVQYVKPLLNEETRLAHAYIGLDNSKGEWHPGSYLTATIEVNRTEHPIVVPKDSIQTMDGFPSVFVYTGEGFEIRPIRLGHEDEEFAEVIGGLSEGDIIALGNTFLLKAEHEKDEAAHEH